jgi:hypothetical protein
MRTKLDNEIEGEFSHLQRWSIMKNNESKKYTSRLQLDIYATNCVSWWPVYWCKYGKVCTITQTIKHLKNTAMLKKAQRLKLVQKRII